MFKLVVEAIDHIQDGMVYGTWAHCYHSKWRFKTTKLTSSFQFPSRQRVSNLFTVDTSLHERTSQAGIATEDSRKNSSNKFKCMDAAPCFGYSAFWGCQGATPRLCSTHILWFSMTHVLTGVLAPHEFLCTQKQNSCARSKCQFFEILSQLAQFCAMAT